MAKRSDTDELRHEEVERRKEPRGLFPALEVELMGKRAGRYQALEASRKGFFIEVDEPDTFPLGEPGDARIRSEGREVSCRVETIRKEIDPRRGVALRIVHIDPKNEELLKELLGPADGYVHPTDSQH